MPIVTPLKASGIYDLGEQAGWIVSVPPGLPAPIDGYTYSIKKNNVETIKSGRLDLSNGSLTLGVVLKEPAMLYLQIDVPGRRQGPAYGAAIAPTGLQPVLPRPRDFDSFWKSKIRLLHRIPVNPKLTPGVSDRDGVDFSTTQMDFLNGEHVYGQLAKPTKPGRYPALLILQWASPPYPLQKNWVVEPASKGFLALNIEPHDVPADAPAAYYRSLPSAIKSYQSIGQDDRDKSYFLDMYLRDYRAVDYLTHDPEWDGKTLIVMGTSMGGQQTLCVAGLHPQVTHLIVEEPSGCDLNAALHGRQEGYPFFPSNDTKVMQAAQYFDCINFAPHIKATSLVAMGFIDTVAPPAGIWTAFNEIRGPKEAAPMIDAPHNNLATYEQQLPYSTRAAKWLDILAKGGRIDDAADRQSN
jgi:cephalosporin-C deacetylase-like acetyl esterase